MILVNHKFETAVENDHFIHSNIISHNRRAVNIIYTMKERRFRIITSNVIICAVLSLVLVTALLALNPEVPADVAANNAVYSGNRTGATVSLMFNVYEGTEYVEQIAALLSERGWSATFFVGGKWAERNGDAVIRLATEGFELGNHGYLHRDHAALGAQQNRDEIVMTDKLLRATLSDLGAEVVDEAVPRLFAPPSGSLGKTMFEVCEELEYKVIMWTRDTIDWRDHDAALIYERAVKDLAAGDLILMHPTEKTVEALPDILDAIGNAGLRAATVTETLSATEGSP